VTPLASVLLQRNPSPMTLEGTNTWIVRAPGERDCVVVDPGEDEPGHLDRVAAQGPVALVLLTHRHPDHASGARRFAELTGAPVRAAHPRLAADPLQDDDVIRVGALAVQVLYTPGHTGDSVCFLLPDEGSVLTGDTVLGGGSPIVKPGRLGQFFDSLDRLSEVLAPPGSVILPGHGPALPDPVPELERRRRSRMKRVAQVADAMAAGIDDADALVDHVYPGIAAELRDAARISVEASMAHLQTVPDPVPS